MNTIRVTGTARLRLSPDVTVITMTLQGVEPEYAAALNRADREAETLRDSLERLAFAREALKTLSFHVSAEYESFEESGVWKQRFAGYRFEHALKAEFDSDNERLSRVLTALADGPVRPTLQIGYAVKDPETAKKTLLTRAVADAEERARILAEAAGAQLKEIRSVDYTFGDTGVSDRPMHRLDAAMTAKAPIDLHLEPDDIVMTDAVTVVWEMESDCC